MKNIKINDRNINIKDDYISLTDMAKYKDTEFTGIIIANWLTTKYAIHFMGIWETLYNPNFNVMEFHNIKSKAGENGFILSSSRWIKATNAIGIKSSTGRYGGGTFAHKDIAFEFATWLSPKDSNIIYANGADILNMALFGITAKDWKSNNKDLEGNIRDYADVTQLICLSNLEVLNSEFIKSGLDQKQRLIKLNEIAISQMTLLVNNNSVKKIV